MGYRALLRALNWIGWGHSGALPRIFISEPFRLLIAVWEGRVTIVAYGSKTGWQSACVGLILRLN
jgi:hypothetical protein